MNLTLKEACRQVLVGSHGTESMWNPYGLGKFANRVLLLVFKILYLAGFDPDFAWAVTEKAEKVYVQGRAAIRARLGNVGK